MYHVANLCVAQTATMASKCLEFFIFGKNVFEFCV